MTDKIMEVYAQIYGVSIAKVDLFHHMLCIRYQTL